jgi:hypothetical protein
MWSVEDHPIILATFIYSGLKFGLFFAPEILGENFLRSVY